MKVASVVGARPQFIKLASVDRRLAGRCRHIVIHTGQHYDEHLSRAIFEDLALSEPDYHLGVGSGPHGRQTGEMLARVEEVLVGEQPDLVLLYGDTNSTLAGALAAVKLHIPVGHVEAGLRSRVMTMPEEINRRLTDHVASLLFAPTRRAVANLEQEGITAGVHLTGDVMVDALNAMLAGAEARQAGILDAYNVAPGEYVLLTIHRPANTDDPAAFCGLLRALAETGRMILFPLHPRTRVALRGLEPGVTIDEKGQMVIDGQKTAIGVVRPATYGEMLVLERNADRIVTDSGGVQKEAFLLGVPCITCRSETEWVETIETGWNVLVGTDEAKILAALTDARRPGERPPVFGDGRSAERVADAVLAFLGSRAW